MPITQNQSVQSYIEQYLEYRVNLINQQVLQIAQEFAPQIQEWMIENKQWEDRTFDATSKLFAEVEELANGAVIYFGGRSDHQKYLEFSMSGRFQIVAPALDYWSVQVYNAVKDALSGVGFTTTEALPYGSTYRNKSIST